MKKILIISGILIITGIIGLIVFKLSGNTINLEKLSMDTNSKEFLSKFDQKNYAFLTDTLYDNEADAYSEHPIKFGLSHDMVISNADPIAKFHGIAYNKINTMETNNGEFVALGAESSISSKKDFDNAVSDLTEEFGKPQITETQFLGRYQNYLWVTADRTIELVSSITGGEGELNIVVDTNEKKVEGKPTETYVSYLFIVKKKHVGYLKGMVSKSGDWVYMD